MAGLEFDLTAPDVWESLYDETKMVERPTPDTFISIPRISIPILLHGRVIVFGTSSANAKPNWRFAGTLTQRLEIPSLGSGLVDGFKQTVRINALSLLVLPNLTPDYRLDLDVFPWIQDISFSLWRYIGPEVDELVQLIETVKVDILRVESKLDYQGTNSPSSSDQLPNDLDNAP
jgi:hypothetical protein